MKFTLDDYCSIITLLNEKGYKIKKYTHPDYEGKEAILRHDIDISIDKALDFAKLEHDMGVESTYFVLLSSKLYNVFCQDCRVKIREIYNLGHSIGLHFDETNYCISNKRMDMTEAVLREKTILENILPGIKIETVSMHMPSKSTLEANFDFDNKLINSYGEQFFKKYKYVSDSEMRWRENIGEVISSEKHEKLHILTHPIWYDDISKTKEEKIKTFLETQKERIYNEIQIIVPGIGDQVRIEDF